MELLSNALRQNSTTSRSKSLLIIV